MTFSVQWSRCALDALAQIWLDSSDRRSEITQAAAMVDQILTIDPQERGESRD